MRANQFRSRSPLILVAILVLTTTLVSACGSKDAGDHATPAMADMAAMPSEVQAAPQRVSDAYRFAAAHPDVLRQFPCYCGCGPMGHDSNLACFWQDDGAVDNHALGCGICVDIAQDVLRGLQRGQSLAEIRAQVDADYSRFGPATDTPPVEG
jgi:hypothetical protein